MIRHFLRHKRRQILIDVSTQRDLLLAEGSSCVGNHRRVLSNIRRMMAWARKNHIHVISTCEVYPADNGHSYCLDGTDGQRKIPYTLLPNRRSFPADEHTALPLDVFRRYRQIILHERCSDPFDEPCIDRLLSDLRNCDFIVIGSAAELSVLSVVLGLLQRGKNVTVVEDAVGCCDKAEGKLALRKMFAKGAKMVSAKSFAGTSHLRSVGVCDCKLCRDRLQKTTQAAVN